MAIPLSLAGYRTFSSKVAPALTALGGTLVVLGGLGPWIRVTRVPVEGGAAEEVARITGRAETTGWALAALGLVVIAGALTWSLSTLRPKLVPALAAVALGGIVGWRLAVLDGQAADIVREAGADPDFFAFHAGFGWGAWFLFLSIVALALGLVVGVLRELDLRRSPGP